MRPPDGRSRAILATGWALAALSATVLAIAGTQEFTGFFLNDPRSCGSVFRLHLLDDLNAVTCQNDLRSRVPLVSAALGSTILFALGAPVVSLASGRGEWTRGLRLALIGIVAIAIAALAISMVTWRHLVWSVSGG